MTTKDIPEPSEGKTPTDHPETTGSGRSDREAFWISAALGVFVASASVWLVSGAPLAQSLLRVRPTVSDGGVGSAWVVGNTEPVLNALVSLIHFADIIMGLFILVMVFVHWGAFRRLAGRMQPPDGQGAESTDGDVATDGGSVR